MFRVEIVKKTLGVALILAGARWGVLGVAWSQVAFAIIALAINAHFAGRKVGLGPFRQARETLPVIAVATVMATLAYWACSVWDASPWIELGVIVPSAAAFYLGAVWWLRVDAAHDVMALFHKGAAAA